jgi:hypothetical protein
MQEAGSGSRALDNDKALAGDQGQGHRVANRLVGGLRSGLRSSACLDNRRASGIQDKEVVVIRGAAQWICPEQVSPSVADTDCHRVKGVKSRPAAKIVQSASPPGHRRGSGAPIGEIALPSTGGPVLKIARIASGREIKRARGRNSVDRLGNRAILEGGFVKVGKIINNDVAAGGPQGGYVGSHGRRAAVSGGEEKR